MMNNGMNEDGAYAGKGDNGNGVQYQTLSKFDRMVAGLQGGNNQQTKPTTIENVNSINGEAETFIVQTIRAEERRRMPDDTVKVTTGDYIVIKYLDKNGPVRLILPPKVAQTIDRQKSALSDRIRSVKSKAAMKQRMADGWKPPAGFGRKGKEVAE